jgi:hypothetical protein
VKELRREEIEEKKKNIDVFLYIYIKKRRTRVLRFNFRVRFKVEEWLIGGIPLKFEWMKINTYGDDERVFNIVEFFEIILVFVF